MGLLAVIVAALAGFGFGAIWYMSLSGPWMEASGVKVGPDGRPAGGNSPTPFIIALVAMVLVAGMMQHMFNLAGIDTWAGGLMYGLGFGALVITPWMAMNYGYAMRPTRLTIIDGGYAILGCGIIGLVLGLF